MRFTTVKVDKEQYVRVLDIANWLESQADQLDTIKKAGGHVDAIATAENYREIANSLCDIK